MRKTSFAIASVLLALSLCPASYSQDAATLTERGLALINGGQFSEAEKSLVQALALAGSENSTALYNLASVYHRQGRYPEALRFHRLALEKIERTLGPISVDAAQSLNDIGCIFRAMGRHSQAIASLERSVEILNTSAELLPTALNNLGVAYHEAGQSAKAQIVLQRALTIAEAASDARRREIPYIVNSLGLAYVNRKQFADAESAFQRAASALVATLGTRHPDYAMALQNLAALYLLQKRFREAEPLSETAISILEQTLHPEALVLAAPLRTYAEILKRLGRKTDAREVARRANAIGPSVKSVVDVRTLRQPAK